MDTLITTQTAAAVREAALPGFIVRKLFAANAKPGRQTILEACRAELAWAHANFCKITGANPLSHTYQADGPHPSEAYRMPHERAAARVLNIAGHVACQERRIRETLITLKAQRAIADDETLNNQYRCQWATITERTEADIAEQLAGLRQNFRLFLKAIRAYREARAAITAPACLVRESNQPGL